MSSVATVVGLVGAGSAIYQGLNSSQAAGSAANQNAFAQVVGQDINNTATNNMQNQMLPWTDAERTNQSRLNYAMYGVEPTPQQQAVIDRTSINYQNYLKEKTGAGIVGDPRGGGYYVWKDGKPLGMFGSSGEAVSMLEKMIGIDPNKPIYNDPKTGQYSNTPVAFDKQTMGVTANSLNPMTQYTTADWKKSPEYEAYNNAKNATAYDTKEALNASAAATGAYGSGGMANALQSNLGRLYATYDPASLAAAQNNWNNWRNTAYNQLRAGATPTMTAASVNLTGQNAANQSQTTLNLGNIGANLATQQAQIDNQMASGIGNVLSSGYASYMGKTPNPSSGVTQPSQSANVNALQPSTYQVADPYSQQYMNNNALGNALRNA